MRIRDRLIKGTALNFIAVAFNQGSTLIINIIVARMLMQQSFGEYAMVQSTLLTVATLSQLATGYTASKYIAEFRSKDPVRAGRIMGVCVMVSTLMAGVGVVILFTAAPWLASAMLQAPHLTHALIIGSGFLFFASINGYQAGALSGLEAYHSLAKAGILSGIAAIVLISLGTYWGGLNGALIGLSVSAFFRCFFHNIWLGIECRQHGIKILYGGSYSQEKAIIIHFALPAAAAGYYSMPMVWFATSFLVRQPGGYGEMALYASATSVRLLVLFLPQVINNVTLSVLNNIKGTSDIKRYNHLYRWNILVILSVTLLSGIVIGLFGDAVLSVFGREFSNGKVILQVLMVSTVLEGLAVALYQHLQAEGKIWLSFLLINVPREAIFVLLALFLVPMYGAIGLSMAYTLCWLVSAVTIGALVLWYKNTSGRNLIYVDTSQ